MQYNVHKMNAICMINDVICYHVKTKKMQIYDKMNDLSLENYFQKYSNLFKKYRPFHRWSNPDPNPDPNPISPRRKPNPEPNAKTDFNTDTLKSICDWLVTSI